MKLFVPAVLAAVLLVSCRSQFPIVYNSNKAKNPQYDSYVKTKSGELYVGDIQKKNEQKIFKPTLFVVNDTAIKAKDVAEYQDNSGSYRRISGELTKALTGPHLLVYKIESTYQTYEAPSMGNGNMGRSRTNRSIRYYLQKNGQSDITLVGLNSCRQLADWVEDYDEAYEQALLAGSVSKKIKLHRLISWGAIIGGGILMFTDPAVKTGGAGNDKLGVQGYGGFALFSGGIVNLCINLGRRGKAGRAYAAAINLYNDKPAKAKR
jgi:hypothetical protein